MLGGGRGILAAFAGLAALFIALFTGAYYGSVYAPEKRHYQSVGPNSGQAYPADSPRNGLADVAGIDRFTESLIAKPQPRSTDEREQRDLAAQESMAVFGYWVFWAMIGQTALAAGALIALVKDLRQNRRSAEAQLRAYISVEPGGMNEAKDGLHRLPYNITNHGQTPAYDLAVFGDILIVSGDPRQFDPAVDGRLGEADASTDITLGPGQNQWNFAYHEPELFEPFWEQIRDKEAAIIHYGFVQYRDAFERTQKTFFAFYHWGEELTDADSKRCRFGNYAT